MGKLKLIKVNDKNVLEKYKLILKEKINSYNNITSNILNKKSRSIYFGKYPQSKIKDDVTITSKKSLDGQCFIGSDGCEYVEKNGEYFKVEPIKWNVISTDDGITLCADSILDVYSSPSYFDVALLDALFTSQSFSGAESYMINGGVNCLDKEDFEKLKPYEKNKELTDYALKKNSNVNYWILRDDYVVGVNKSALRKTDVEESPVGMVLKIKLDLCDFDFPLDDENYNNNMYYIKASKNFENITNKYMIVGDLFNLEMPLFVSDGNRIHLDDDSCRYAVVLDVSINKNRIDEGENIVLIYMVDNNG